MDGNRKELFNQIRKEKQEEYDKVYRKKYSWSLGAVFFVSCIVNYIFDLNDSIYGLAVTIIMALIFSLWWEKRKKK